MTGGIMSEMNESKFNEVFTFSKKNIFDEREQFGEAIASKLYRHGYCYCQEQEVHDYIEKMLKQSGITYKVEENKKIRYTEYKFVIQ